MYVSVEITPDGIKVNTLRSDTGYVMNETVLHPRYLTVELPTGEVISFETVLQHLVQEFGPWPAK